MKTTLIIGVVLALVIGGGIGYVSGKSGNDMSAHTKELEDSVTMMKEQTANMQTMAGMMKSGGVKMQEMGMQYKDDVAVSKGKDMEAMGAKYMTNMMVH